MNEGAYNIMEKSKLGRNQGLAKAEHESGSTRDGSRVRKDRNSSAMCSHCVGPKLQGQPFKDISLWTSVNHGASLVTAFPRRSCDSQDCRRGHLDSRSTPAHVHHLCTLHNDEHTVCHM